MMTTTLGSPVMSPVPAILFQPSRWFAELRRREPRLAAYAAIVFALLVPFAIGMAIDVRQVAGMVVWYKPAKFALSIAVLAATTAWFIGHLPAAVRRGRAVDRIVWLLIASASFELGYITLQAGLGEASHYNDSDLLHGVMYTLMGIGALILTATQPMLAWLLMRHPDPARPAIYRQAILVGLVLTFVFGAGAGMLLSGLQPPVDVARVPLIGWSLTGDLRPAHFVGIHAEQVLPLVGLAAASMGGRLTRPAVWAATLLYAALFLALVAWALATRA